MKRQLILLALACAVALTACSKSEEVNDGQTASETQSVTENVTESATESVTESITESTTETTAAETEDTETGESTDSADKDNSVPKEDYPDYLYGPGMDKISVDEITEINNYDVETKWHYAACDGFTYLAEPNGITYNSIDNADIYDGELAFSGVPEAPAAEYKRYKVGDTVCGLTVKEAESRFLYNPNMQEGTEGYFQGGMAVFDGSAELSGYLVILADDEYAVGGNGDAIFIPDSDGQVLPVLNYDAYSAERGVYSTLPDRCYIAGGVAFQSEYSFIACGNVENYDNGLFDSIEWNTPTRVKLTIENITMSSNIEWFANMSATVTNLEIL